MITRRFFLIGSAAMLAAAKVVGPEKLILKSEPRLYTDLAIFSESEGPVEFFISRRGGQHGALLRGAIGRLGAWRWMAPRGAEIIADKPLQVEFRPRISDVTLDLLYRDTEDRFWWERFESKNGAWHTRRMQA